MINSNTLMNRAGNAEAARGVSAAGPVADLKVGPTYVAIP